MVWQDIGFGVISVLLSVVLIPQFVDVITFKLKINIATGILTGSCLAIMAFMYATLNMPVANITTVITALMWFIMAIYSARSYISPMDMDL